MQTWVASDAVLPFASIWCGARAEAPLKPPLLPPGAPPSVIDALPEPLRVSCG